MKRIVAVLICMLLILTSLTFSVTDVTAANLVGRSVAYQVGENSTGSGVVEIETPNGTSVLNKSGDSTIIGLLGKVKVTVTADRSCVIREIKINGERKGSYIDAVGLTFTFENYPYDLVIEVTYELVYYKCPYTYSGQGSITVREPAYYYDNDCSILYGDTLAYNVKAAKGYEILSIVVDGQELDLAEFGKTPNNKMDSVDLTLEQITTSHTLDVVFSGTDDPDNLRERIVTVSYDETRGVCNGGINRITVVEGSDCKIRIVPNKGYAVDRIVDGNSIITDFEGEYYTVENIINDRAVNVLFKKVDADSDLGIVGTDETLTEATEGSDDVVEYPYEPETTVPEVFSPTCTHGDANVDGKVNILDVTIVQKAVAGLTVLDLEEMIRADVDADGLITVKDATLIQKKIAYLIQKFPGCVF